MHAQFMGHRDRGRGPVLADFRCFGHTDVIVLGDITTARGPEMMLPVWLRLWNAVGTPMFTFKIAR